MMRSIIQPIYDATIRPHLPRKWGVYDGIPVRSPRLFDATDEKPNYKAGLKQAISEHVGQDDHVELVGGGRGISSVWCAEQGATVTAYEAAEQMAQLVEETTTRQDVAERVTVIHALVGEGIDVYGSAAKADVVHPSEIGRADALVMDCEGAETSILDGLEMWPETIIVESHPEWDAPGVETASTLQDRGYSIQSYEYTPGREDKPVLAATMEKKQ